MCGGCGGDRTDWDDQGVENNLGLCDFSCSQKDLKSFAFLNVSGSLFQNVCACQFQRVVWLKNSQVADMMDVTCFSRAATVLLQQRLHIESVVFVTSKHMISVGNNKLYAVSSLLGVLCTNAKETSSKLKNNNKNT